MIKKPFILAMISSILIVAFCVIAEAQSSEEKMVVLDNLQQFNELYEAWLIAINQPEIASASSNGSYQNIPEYQAMIEMGESALNGLYHVMKSEEGMYHMLFLAVIEIKGWNENEFLKSGRGNQEITKKVIERLEKQGYPKF